MRLKLVAVIVAWSAVTLVTSAGLTRSGCGAGGTVVAVQPLLLDRALVASVRQPNCNR